MLKTPIEQNDLRHYLPHCGDMLLIDRVLSFDASHLMAESAISATSPTPLHKNGKLGCFALIEIGAQASGLHLALNAHKNHQSKQGGYLMQVSNAEINQPYCPDGMLSIQVECLAATPDAAQYQLFISHQEQSLVSAEISLALKDV